MEGKLKRARSRTDSNNSDDIELTNTTKKTKTITDSNNTAWTKYFIIESKHSEGTTLDRLSPFAVQKYVTTLVGDVHMVKKLRCGSLLVEVADQKQSTRITNIKAFGEIELKVSAHRSLNSKKGVIRSFELKDIPEDELRRELRDKGVTDLKRIQVTRNGKKENTNTIILTFETHKLPEFITAGYLRLAVSQFIPNPLRCYKCQRFGHHKEKCRSDMACQICSEVGHDTRECQKPPKCRNCEGNHSPNAKECPAWKKEKKS